MEFEDEVDRSNHRCNWKPMQIFLKYISDDQKGTTCERQGKVANDRPLSGYQSYVYRGQVGAAIDWQSVGNHSECVKQL
jgi:hypothetical protein